MKRINSLNNPIIKAALKLAKRREREKQNRIIIEGYPEIVLAGQAGIELVTLFYCPELSAPDRSPDKLLSRETVIISPEIAARLAYREHPGGYIALAKPRYTELAEIKLSKNPLLLVVEAVEKPGNLGAILRTADAVGADAVLVCDEHTDIFNPNIIRASLGTVFANRVVVLGRKEMLAWLEDKSVRTYATTPLAKVCYHEADFRTASAILVGAEHAGLSRKLLEAADEKIRIPMRGRVDSLNASVSAAIVLYEALRQRADND